VHPAQLAGGDRDPGGSEARVEPPLEADLHRYRRRPHLLQHDSCARGIRSDGLLAEHRDARVDRCENQGRVGVGGGRDHQTVDISGEKVVRRRNVLGAQLGRDLSRRDGTASATTRLSTSSISESVRAWYAPIRPTPATPIRIVQRLSLS